MPRRAPIWPAALLICCFAGAAAAENTACAANDLACRVAELERRVDALEHRTPVTSPAMVTPAPRTTEIDLALHCAIACREEAQSACAARGFAHGRPKDWQRDRMGLMLSRATCSNE